MLSMEQRTQNNPYLAAVPLTGSAVTPAMAFAWPGLAWRARDPEGAAKELGRVIEPGHEQRIDSTPPADAGHDQGQETNTTQNREEDARIQDEKES